jgi:hypothetical protein
MHKVNGGCHCGNIRVDIELARVPGTYIPRACDCDFCRKHGASYVSDPQGSLLIRIRDERQSGSYRQGSGLAEFLHCRNCGVLVGALYRSDGRLYAAVNAQAVDARVPFGAEQPVSPKKLSDSEKMGRWQDVWFSNVSVVNVAT